jgi:mRNA interferase MazF
MVKGDIVLIAFPFTDLSGSKLRPAVVLAEVNMDITVCLITHEWSHGS